MRQPDRRSPRTRRRALLESYVAPQVVAHILSDGRTPLPSGVRMPVTVLFADIRGFTRFSTTVPAKQVVAFLDDYFEGMIAAAAAHGAMVDKLMGDAVMVLFGVPNATGDEAARAILTATAMHEAFGGVLDRWRGRVPAGVRLGLGVGCASGDAVLANIGSATRMDYTVIGEPVNLASRLTGVAPHGVTLVGDAVRSAALASGGAAVRFGPPRHLAVKGIRGAVIAYAARASAMRSRAVPTSTTDPVCGMKLAANGGPRLTYRGRTYHFCTATCRDQFRRQPARFVASRR